jgi:hypothetical protein
LHTLGDATAIAGVEIHWPSGAKETLKFGDVDRIYTATEGKDSLLPYAAAKLSKGT